MFTLNYFQQEKQAQSAGTSEKKSNPDTDEDDTSSDSSDEEESPRALSYRTPFLTQACHETTIPDQIATVLFGKILRLYRIGFNELSLTLAGNRKAFQMPLQPCF